jgi:hypothetical protein
MTFHSINGREEAAEGAPVERLARHHASAIHSVYVALRQLDDQIRRYAEDGRAADGSGELFAPFPSERWAALRESLDALLEEARRAVRLFAPDRLQAHEALRPLSATRVAVALRLALMLEYLSALQPEDLGRTHGELPATAAAELGRRVERMEEALRRAIETVEAMAGKGST